MACVTPARKPHVTTALIRPTIHALAVLLQVLWGSVKMAEALREPAYQVPPQGPNSSIDVGAHGGQVLP